MKTTGASLLEFDRWLEQRAELLSEAACVLPELFPAEREELRAHVVDFLQHEIGGHMLTEERLLYPRLAERLGDPLAAAPLNYEHRAIRWWTDRIAAADVDDTARLQRLLYGVHALISVHLSREEELYAGVVDSLVWPAAA